MADEEQNVTEETPEETPEETSDETPPVEPAPPVPDPEARDQPPEPAPEPVAETEAEEAPAAEAPAEVVAEEAPAEEGPAEEAPAEEAPAAEAPAAEAQVAPAKKKRKRVPRSERRQRPKPKREQTGERKPITRPTAPSDEHDRGRRQERRGVVVSAALDKTIVVSVDVVKAHPKYKKVVRRSQRFHAHDEQNQAKAGDVVRIVETRPLSKTKNWRLAEVVEVAR